MENRSESPKRRRMPTRTTLRWNALVAVALVAGVVLYATAALADSTVTVPIDTVHRGVPGQVFPEATIDAVGACAATLRWDNNVPEPSEHPDTDIIVGPVTFTNVERGDFVDAALTFTGTGPTDVSTRLGGDGVTSGGFTLEVSCQESSTTTTPPDTTTTTAGSTPPTSTPNPVTTSTLSPPPLGPVETGFGSCADGACDYQWWTDPVILGLVLIFAALLATIGALASKLVRSPE